MRWNEIPFTASKNSFVVCNRSTQWHGVPQLPFRFFAMSPCRSCGNCHSDQTPSYPREVPVITVAFLAYSTPFRSFILFTSLTESEASLRKNRFPRLTQRPLLFPASRCGQRARWWPLKRRPGTGYQYGTRLGAGNSAVTTQEMALEAKNWKT